MIFRSSYPEVTIPAAPLTDIVLEGAAARGDQPALIEWPSRRVITYAQLAAGVHALAAGLLARGFRQGEVFAIYCPNVPEYPLAYHGVLAAGGTVTTVNPLYTVEELTHQLRDSGASYLLTIPQCLDKALAAAQLSGIKELFVLGEGKGATPFAALLTAGGASPKPDIHPGDVAALPYSSGTTGLCKGVMLSHRNLVAALRQMEAGEAIEAGEVIIGVLPFFHIFGQHVIMNMGLHYGATIVTVARFELESFLQALQEYGVTRAYLVPPIVLALAKHPIVAKYDLSKLRRILVGAAPLGAELTREVSARLGCIVRQGYGMTETSPPITMSPAEPERIKAGAVGVVVANTECKILDPATGAELGTDERGEICMRGPQVMKGYRNRPEATAAMIDAEGWLHTGDVGYFDTDGQLFIVDRVKELIKYKGLQVAPAELEAVLLMHPAVADAAVIGVPDDEAGEAPKAFVVLKGQATPEEIMSFVASRVAPYKKVRRVEIIEQIPKSPSGKILRRVLKERG